MATPETTDMREELITPVSSARQECIPMIATSAEGMGREADWIQANIKKRVCTRYVKATKELPDFGPDFKYTDLGETCECGHTPEEHSVKQSYVGDARLLGQRDSDEWNADYDTQTEPTDAFGELDFIDSSKKVAKYVRIDERTEPDTIKQLLFEAWKLDKPTLVISVIGGASVAQAKPKVQQAVRRGLVKVVRSGAWLLTSGVRQGIMRIVGEAASTTAGDASKTVCLGVLPWGAVANRHELIKTDAHMPARYTISEAPQTRGLSLPLEPNHTHFLLVDNGTARLYGTESIMRGKVEQILSDLTQDNAKKAPEPEKSPDLVTFETAEIVKTSLHVPLCCVMFGGGMPTFKVMHNSLKKGMPVIVVNRSGRLADLVAFAVDQFVGEDVVEGKPDDGPVDSDVKSKFASGTEEELTTKLKDEVDSPDEIPPLIDRILSVIAEFYELLHVFDSGAKSTDNSANSLDLIILQAILRSAKSDNREAKQLNQLSMAMQWNRPDIAQAEVLTGDFKLRTSTMADLFSKAVAQNKPLFVKMMLDQGFNLHDYLTKDILVNLYNEPCNTPFMLLLADEVKRQKLLRSSKRKRNLASLSDVGRVIMKLCGGMYYSSYQHDPAKCDVSYNMLFISEMDHQRYLQQKDKWKRQNVEDRKVVTAADYGLGSPALHLFLYSVLLNRKDLAMIFWNEAPQKLAAAQMASFMLDKLMPYATDRDERKSVTENELFFDQLAVGVLDACYSADQPHTHLLILRELKEFASSTCIELAHISSNMAFIAHPACQSLLNDIWTGELYKSPNVFALLMCIIFPPFILLLKFHANQPPAIVTTITPPTLQTESSAEIEESCVRPPPPISFSCSKSLQRILQFYVSPQITFLSNVASYVTFIALFTMMVLGDYVDDCSADMSWLEITLIIWVLCLFAEELRQLVNEPGTIMHKIKLYITNPWNQLDVISISCFLIAELLSTVDSWCAPSMAWIRVLVGISIFICYNRLLQAFSANEAIGPKLVMIFRMFKDIMIIMAILVVILMGYTVVVVSMISADQPMGFDRFASGFSLVYWSMFGNLPLDTFGSVTLSGGAATVGTSNESYADNSTNAYLNSSDASDYTTTLSTVLNTTAAVAAEGTTSVPDPVGGYYLILFLGVFVILTNLLLFNVLIAMFNYTFSVVQDKADQYWCYQRYILITEYYARPAVPPPLLLVYHVWLVVKYIFAKVRSMFSRDPEIVVFASEQDCKVKCDNSVERQLITWEDLVVDEYLETVERTEKESVDKQVENIREQVYVMKDTVSVVENIMENVESNTNALLKGDNIGKRLTSLETQVSDLTTNMQEVLKLLRAKK